MDQQRYINQPALVDPKLSGDPEGRKNQTGIIMHIDLEKDEVTVSFADEGCACFPACAILVLRDPDEIKRDADNDATLLPYWDYYDICDVILFAESGKAEYRLLAVELSQKNPEAMEYTMERLRTGLGLTKAQYMSR